MTVLGLSEQDIIEKYLDSEAICPVLNGGGVVVGQEIDEDDHLVYVIRRDDTMSIVHAMDIEIGDLFTPRTIEMG